MSENNLMNNLKYIQANAIRPLINEKNLNKCQIVIPDLNEQKNIKDNNDNYQNSENQNERGKTIMSNKNYTSMYQNGGNNRKEFFDNYSKICDDKINKQQNENNSGKNSNSSHSSNSSNSSKNNEEKIDTEILNIENNGIVSFTHLKKQLTNKNKKIKELNNKINETEEAYKNRIEELEKENCELKAENQMYKNRIAELEKENRELKAEKKLTENPICSTIHYNKKCEQCFTIPIKGYRYKCWDCKKNGNNDYNLCQQCYEKNAESRIHPHFFCLIKDNNSNSINNDSINISRINSNVIEYSYKCISTNLTKIINKGINETKVQINLENNCQNKWPENTKLIYDKNSQILTGDIILENLEPNEQMEVNIYFKDLKNLSPNSYEVYFDFNVNGINFGEKLCIIIVIEKENLEEIVKKFRKEYNTPSSYTDEAISSVLEKTDKNFEDAFFNLYFEGNNL